MNTIEIYSSCLRYLRRQKKIPTHAHSRLAFTATRLIQIALTSNKTHFNGSASWVFGIGGPPGSGKSSLTQLIASVLNNNGHPTTVLHLDDYYLDRTQRLEMARREHPLFAWRGPPGTHHTGRLLADLKHLLLGQLPIKLPKFDKTADCAAGAEHQQTINTAPRLIILEGWLIGCPPLTLHSLNRFADRWTQRNDPDSAWRQEVCRHLQEDYRELQQALHRIVYLRPPGWLEIVDWRYKQEQAQALPMLRNRTAVAAFLAPYRILINYLQASCLRNADTTILLNTAQRSEAILHTTRFSADQIGR